MPWQLYKSSPMNKLQHKKNNINPLIHTSSNSFLHNGDSRTPNHTAPNTHKSKYTNLANTLTPIICFLSLSLSLSLSILPSFSWTWKNISSSIQPFNDDLNEEALAKKILIDCLCLFSLSMPKWQIVLPIETQILGIRLFHKKLLP